MEITIKNTTKIVELNGVPARVWEGETSTGVPIHCFITRIAVNKNESPENIAIFENELEEMSAPVNADIDSYPSRIII